MKTWSEIYSQRLNQSYFDYFKKQYAPFLELIERELKATEYMYSVELGCGIGNVTRYIQELNPKSMIFQLIDSCPEMLAMAIKNTKSDWTTYKCRDITTAPTFFGSLIHSHGVLEHLTDEQIKSIVSRNSCAGNLQIHYIPTDKWITPSRGDERLLSKEYWKELTSPKDMIEFNEGKDLVIII